MSNWHLKEMHCRTPYTSIQWGKVNSSSLIYSFQESLSEVANRPWPPQFWSYRQSKKSSELRFKMSVEFGSTPPHPLTVTTKILYNTFVAGNPYEPSPKTPQKKKTPSICRAKVFQPFPPWLGRFCSGWDGFLCCLSKLSWLERWGTPNYPPVN